METQVLTNLSKSVGVQLSREVSILLTGLGIYPSRKGHAVLRDAILCDVVRFRTSSRRENLYRLLSDRHSCSAQACEACIRNALKGAHRTGHLMRFNALLGLCVIDQKFPPQNLEFISLAAQYCYYRFVETDLSSASR